MEEPTEVLGVAESVLVGPSSRWYAHRLKDAMPADSLFPRGMPTDSMFLGGTPAFSAEELASPIEVRIELQLDSAPT